MTSLHNYDNNEQPKPAVAGLGVCVYCASHTHLHDVYFDAAKRLATLLVNNDWVCINGAGKKGLMGAINDTIISLGGRVKGIIPRFMVDSGWCHPNLTELIITETMHERKQTMAAHADAVIAMPGGVGTLEELLEIITWRQLHLYRNPVVILNVNDYYAPLLSMFDRMIEQKFLSASSNRLWKVVSSPEEAVEYIAENGRIGRIGRK